MADQFFGGSFGLARQGPESSRTASVKTALSFPTSKSNPARSCWQHADVCMDRSDSSSWLFCDLAGQACLARAALAPDEKAGSPPLRRSLKSTGFRAGAAFCLTLRALRRGLRAREPCSCGRIEPAQWRCVLISRRQVSWNDSGEPRTRTCPAKPHRHPSSRVIYLP